MTESYWRIAVTVPKQASKHFSTAIEALTDGIAAFEVVKGGDWLIEGYRLGEPDHAQVTAALSLAAAAGGIPEPEIACEPLPDIDWVAENQKTFKPIAAGRFFVKPSHFDGRVPAGAAAVTVDAGSAFGSGEHASTLGCLLALDGLARRRRFLRPLDLGCGSGILSLGMARLWKVPIVAADIDAESVRVTKANLHLNGVHSFVRAVESDGFGHPLLRGAGPYDLIVANILAGPLARLAPKIAANLEPGGWVVLSGLLVEQDRLVAAAFRRQGLVPRQRITREGWRTILLSKPPRAGALARSRLAQPRVAP